MGASLVANGLTRKSATICAERCNQPRTYLCKAANLVAQVADSVSNVTRGKSSAVDVLVTSLSNDCIVAPSPKVLM
jgi:hypothetical protein